MRSLLIRLIAISLSAISICPSYGQQPPTKQSTEDLWVDSVLNSLSLEQKIGQLFMVTTYSNQEEKDYRYIERLIKSQHLGGLIFMQGTPERQITLVNRYQKISPIPLLIAQDAEWGISMRLKETQPYPKNMTLGAIRNDSLLYQMGIHMGRELKRVGVQVNFAPVVDVNNNPNNPVINYRSFGENRYRVARKGIMLTNGIQNEGVMACAKHFPGHGDTETDSHYDLPLIAHSVQRLDSLELYPFSKLMQAGVGAVMVAHLYIPALDPTPNLPTSMSPRIITDLLRKRMGYDGLIFTDALNMQGVTKFYEPGEVSLQAFLAGNDMLLSPNNVPRAASLMLQSIEDGKITVSDLDSRVRRILKAKYRTGLANYYPLKIEGLRNDINSMEARILRKKLYEASLTLVKNENQLLPLNFLDKRKIAYVQIGGASESSFEQSLRKYTSVTPFFLRKGFSLSEKEQLLDKLRAFNTVIIGLRGMSTRASQNYGINRATENLCRELTELNKHTVLTVFGSPYVLKSFGEQDAILLAYEDVPEAGQAAAEAIFGGLRVDGRLPVTASDKFQEGLGLVLDGVTRFGFALPEEKGMDSEMLEKIDSLAWHYIARKAMPGCQILVMRGRDIVYEKSFGRMTYSRYSPQIDSYKHTYDLASVTKVAATTLATMNLVERGMLDLDTPIHTYLPDLKGTNKANLTVRRLLNHNAGLPGWASLYTETYADAKRSRLDPRFFSQFANRSFQVEVAPSLYATPELENWTWEKIKELKVRNTQSVRYSDIGMIILGKIIDRVSGSSMESLMTSQFYQRLGMDHTYFRPATQQQRQVCPPTESDRSWRKSLIQGFVHDPTAVMLGGVAGHAGLFGNAYDMAKLMLMVKNGGIYGERRYFRPSTIDQFTQKQLRYSRRGLGWDKPEFRPNRSTPVSDYASPATYGHTGFTGTSVWVDPKYDLIYIFLSNRTFPNPRRQRLLIRENVRILVMDKIYEALFTFKAKEHHRLRMRANMSR